jgi:hypothetical protein
MTLTNDTLAERFVRGHASGSSSRMSLARVDDVTVVVGYGWAVYAAKSPGRYYLFGDGYASDSTAVGWSGYSSTTTKHIQTIKAALEEFAGDYSVVDHRLEMSELVSSPPEAAAAYLDELKREHGTEPLEYTGYHYMK